MRQTHPTRKNFGEIFVLTFKIYFKDFWRNLGFASLVVGTVLVFAIPFIVIFAVSFNATGYPFVDMEPGALIAMVVSYLLLLIPVAVIAPSLLTGYFSPKTIDFLEGKQRDKGVRSRVMFQSLGRISGAQTVYLLAYLLPIIVLECLMFSKMGGINMMMMANMDYDYLFDYIGLSFLAYIVYYVILLLGVFTKQVALFEHKRWFGALGKSIKTIASGNFWISAGYYIVFGLVVGIAAYFVFIFAFINLFILVVLLAGIGSASAITASASAGMIVLAVILGLIALAIIIAIYAVEYGLFSVFTTLAYFNARTKSEGIPFPAPENEEGTAVPEGQAKITEPQQ